MGLRDKVALMFVSILITQVTLILSMPRSSRKEALKHYLGNFNQCKTSPVSGRGSKTNIKWGGLPSNIKKSNNAKTSSNITPTKSILNTYNFPEMEYPLDTSPRDPFYCGMNSNPFNRLNKQVASPQTQIINDLKKEMKLNRKLNRVRDKDYQIKREMPSHTVSFNDHETFPQVEYPMTAMETWEPHYWNTMFNQNSQQNNLDFQTFDPTVIDKSTIFYKPKQSLKSKTKQYVEEMDRLKEKMQKISAASTLKTTGQDDISILTSNLDPTNLSKSGNTTQRSSTRIIQDSNTTCVLPVINKTDIDCIEDKCLLNVNITGNCEPTDPISLSDTITDTEKTVDSKEIVASEIDSDIILMTPIPVLYINLDVCPVTASNKTENTTLSIVQSNAESANEEPFEYWNEFDITRVEVPSVQHEANSEITDEIKVEAPLDEKLSGVVDVMSASITDHSNVCLKTDNTTHVPDAFESTLNIKVPFPEMYVPENLTSQQTFSPESASTVKQSHVDKVPYTSVIVVPVGDSVKEIQLPTIESNTGAPIIIFVPATHSSETRISSVDSPKVNSSDTVVPTELSYNNMPSNAIPEKSILNDVPSKSHMVDNIQHSTTMAEPENSNNQLILFEGENLPINSMCHGMGDTSIKSTYETNEDVSTFDAPFLEMLQPMIAIADIASDNFPTIEETLSLVPDASEASYNLEDNFSFSEKPITLVLPQSITKDFSNRTGLWNDFASTVHDVPISTWEIENNVNRPETSSLLPSPDVPIEIDSAIFKMNGYDVSKENVKQSQEHNINEDKLLKPIDLLLPIDLAIDMIKNGTLLPVHQHLETPVINIEAGPMGPVVELFSKNVPTNELEENTFESPNEAGVIIDENNSNAPQAMQLQGIKSFNSRTDSFLPAENTQSAVSDLHNRSPLLLYKYVTHDYRPDLSQFNKNKVRVSMEKELLKPVNKVFNSYNNIEKNVLLTEDTKNNEFLTPKTGVPWKDKATNLYKNNTILKYTNTYTDAPVINVEISPHRPTNTISSGNLPNNQEYYLEHVDDDEVVDFIHETPRAMKLQDVQSFPNPEEKPLLIYELRPSTQITEKYNNTESLTRDVVNESNTSDEVLENDNMMFMLDEAVTEPPSIDVIEDYIPFQMNNFLNTPITDKEETNMDNSAANTLNSDTDKHLPVGNKELKNHKNERNGGPLKPYDVDTVRNFKKLHASPFANTDNIKDSGLNTAPTETATSYLSEEELLPANSNVKHLL